METEKKTTVRDAFLRTLAVLGLIAILLLGAWGIIQLAVAIPTLFSNLGNGIFNRTTTTAKEAVVVTAPATLGSGQTAQLTWVHNNKASGTQYAYSISYACADNLTLKAPLPNGSYQEVPCSTAFNYTNATSRMTVIPTVTGSADVTLAVTVAASKLSSGALAASGTGTTKVSPAKTTISKPAAKPATSTQKPAATYYAAPKAASLYGYGDLQTTMLASGPAANGLTSIKFEIKNVGTNVINAGWIFSANLPINGTYTFQSQPQQALNPGDKIVYSMQFAASVDYATPYSYSGSSYYGVSGYNCNGYNCTNYPNYQPTPYTYNTGSVVITADPMNWVYESNKANNTAQTTVQMPLVY